MSRPKGARDSDHEAKRRDLLAKMSRRMMRRSPARPSLRNLAAAADVSVPTLRHYFGGRPAVIDAILAECLRLGREGLDAQNQSPKPFADSIHDYAQDLVLALTAARDVRLGDVFAVSLAEGMLDADVSRSTLTHIVDPTLKALEIRLGHHMDRGEMTRSDARSAALMLVSPLLLACLHQNQLGGAAVRPLSLDLLTRDVATAFVRAFSALA